MRGAGERWSQATWKNFPKEHNKKWYWMWSCSLCWPSCSPLSCIFSKVWTFNAWNGIPFFVKAREEWLNSSFLASTSRTEGLPRWHWVVKNPPANAGRCKRHRFHPWVGKVLWRRAQKPSPRFLPGESRGQRSLAGCSPSGHRVRHYWSDLAQHTQWTENNNFITQN